MLEKVRVEEVSVDLSFTEFEALTGWCIRGVRPGFLAARGLKRAGVWETGELSARGQELTRGLTGGSVYFNVLKYTPVDLEHVMIWAGTAGVTCARRYSRNVRIWAVDSCELPAILADCVGFAPRVTYSCGPYFLPADVGTCVVQGNVAGLRLALAAAGAKYEATPPEGEAAVTPLSYGLSRELWELAVVQTSPFGREATDGGSDRGEQSVIYLSVPESMYALRGQRDEQGDFVGYAVSATRPLMEWAGLVELCGDVL